MTRNPVGKLLLFGATGDLAQRMLLPSLFNLHSDGLLPEGLTITGTVVSPEFIYTLPPGGIMPDDDGFGVRLALIRDL